MKLGWRTSGSLRVLFEGSNNEGVLWGRRVENLCKEQSVWVQTSTLFEVCKWASWMQSSHFIVAKNKVYVVWKSRSCAWNVSLQTRAKIKALFCAWCHVSETVPFCISVRRWSLTDSWTGMKLCGKSSNHSGAQCYVIFPDPHQCWLRSAAHIG